MMYLRQMLSDLGQTATELKLGLRGKNCEASGSCKSVPGKGPMLPSNGDG